MKVMPLEIHYLHPIDHLIVQGKLRIFSEPGYVDFITVLTSPAVCYFIAVTWQEAFLILSKELM